MEEGGNGRRMGRWRDGRGMKEMEEICERWKKRKRGGRERERVEERMERDGRAMGEKKRRKRWKSNGKGGRWM
jgi:hypothetical protein